jgi:AbrB family looped-hinge helix DNA binding protein
MRITTKGQVTIPQEIREKHGFHPHTEVEFVVERGRVFLKRKKGAATAAERLMQHLRNAPKMRMSSKELLAILRDEPDELDAD